MFCATLKGQNTLGGGNLKLATHWHRVGNLTPQGTGKVNLPRSNKRCGSKRKAFKRFVQCLKVNRKF